MKRVTKISRLREYYLSGNYREALKIASKFFTGLTKEELNIFRKAYECSNPITRDFYASIGTDIEKAIDDGIKLIGEKYVNNKRGLPRKNKRNRK